MKYNKYRSMTHSMPQLARGLGHMIKKTDYDAAVQLQLSHLQSAGLLFGNLMQDYILAEEDFWLNRNGCPIIFPHSLDVVESLLESTYAITNPDDFSLPFQSFMLAMPQGFKVNDVEIPTCLVTWIDGEKHLSTTLDGFLARHGYPPSNIQMMDENKGKKTLAIVAQTRDKQYSRVMCYHDLIPTLLSANSLTEFRELVGNMSDETIAADLDEYDSQQHFVLLKLIASLGIYINACGAENCLVRGILNPKQRDSALPKTIKAVKAFNLYKAEQITDLNVTEAEHVHIEAGHTAEAKTQWVIRKRSAKSPLDFKRD